MKRETTFTSEIQKLRLENEKLRKQAEASSNQLKKQLPNQDEKPNVAAATASVDASVVGKKTDNDDNISETSTLIVKDEMKPSLKRKASISDPQLSPPPTPEAMRGNNKQHAVVVTTPVGHQQKKNKMVKQTKSLLVATTTAVPNTMSMTQQLPMYVPVTSNATSMINTPAASLIDSPWSPVDDNRLHSSLLTYPPNTTNNNPTNNTPNYFDMASPSSSNANMLYDLYTDNIHPMLLAPYYIPSETTTTTTTTNRKCIETLQYIYIISNVFYS